MKCSLCEGLGRVSGSGEYELIECPECGGAGTIKVTTVLGIDPGFSKLGVARISLTRGGVLRCEGVAVVKTAKASKKERVALRVSADDVRRSKVLWDGISALAGDIPNGAIDAVAYEVYQPIPGKASSGTKVAMAVGLALGLGFTLRVPVYAVLPQDVKRETVGRQSASKAAVREALCERIPGLRDHFAGIPDSHLEHASDAAAVALVGLKTFAGY